MNETDNIFGLINRNLSESKPFVLATIVRTTGSSPRHTGAKMLIYSDGTISGTIGGGKFEKMVIEDSIRLLDDDQQTQFKNYKFTGEGPDSTGMTNTLSYRIPILLKTLRTDAGTKRIKSKLLRSIWSQAMTGYSASEGLVLRLSAGLAP